MVKLLVNNSHQRLMCPEHLVKNDSCSLALAQKGLFKPLRVTCLPCTLKDV